MNDTVSGIQRIFYPFREIDFLFIVVILGLAGLLYMLVQRLLPLLAEKSPGKYRNYIYPLVPILRLLILFSALVTVVPEFIRPTFQNIIAVFGAFGLAAGIAFKDYISSLLAGIVAVTEHPYRLGDRVSIDGAYGEVKAIGLRAVQILTPDDTTVSIPHTVIWSRNIYNANSGNRSQLCVAEFYLHPDHDGQRVRDLFQDVILSSPYLQLQLPVTVTAAEKPWGTLYRLKAYPLDGRDEFQFITDLTVRGKAALREMGIRQVTSPLPVPVNGVSLLTPNK